MLGKYYMTIFCFVVQVHSQRCRNALLNTVSEVVTTSNKVIFDKTTNGLDLLVTIQWNATIPSGLELDGYLFHMGENTFLPSLPPYQHCNPRKTAAWVRSVNDSACVAHPHASCVTRNVSTGVVECLCNISTCALTLNELTSRCTGIRQFVLNRNFISASSATRSLTFKVEFMKSYKFSLLPYHRESVAFRFTGLTDIEAITQCVELVRRDLPGLSQIQGEELCCGAGIAQRVPRDVTVGRFTPTILHGDVINLSVEISWRPPVTQQNLLGIEIFVFPANSMLQQPNKTDIAEFNVVRNGSSCDDNSTLTYTVNVTGLILEETYTVRVEPRYSSSVCTNPQCIATISFTPEVDVCSPEWNICDVNATCLSSSTNQSATCNCTLGFEGNGLNNGSGELGTGCSDINYCSPDKSPCVEEATCVDLPAPMLGATCVCPFTGDGLLNGSGCTPISTLILGVTIPAVTLLLLLVILIAWRIRVRNIRKKELTWSEFVANKSRMMDFIAAKKIQELGENQPVFGEKWELSENDIVFGEVLGRGNYGVVHRGCYNGQDSIDNGEGKATEGVPVAIKTMKDGVYSKNKLVEFLSEIHFMLNIGSHPNVLGVIGCCTVKQPIMLVTELLKYGDLLAFLHEAREPNKRNIDPVYHITEKSLWNIAHQVALGLEYLTKTRIIHGDVAARNILVGENLVCKIADFGLANDVYRYGVIKGRAEKCVPLKWVSPERMQSGEVPITSRSDVWSFGILLYEMTTLGGSPYPGIDQDTLLMKIKAGYRMEKPASCSTEMYALMKKCWKLDPWKRPTFTQVVKELNAAILRMKVVDNNDIVVELDNSIYENIDFENGETFDIEKTV